MSEAILSQFSQKKQAPAADAHQENTEDAATLADILADERNEDEEVEDELDADDSDEIDPAVEKSDQEMIEEVDLDVDLNDRLPPLTVQERTRGRYSVLKLRNLAKKIVHSPTIKADLAAACMRSEITPRLMVRDVSTRWNSTAELLQRGLELREALKLLVVMQEHNRPRGARLRRFQLSPEEWKLLEDLSPLLDVCCSALLDEN
ncbi:hypothetical protein B0H13DRAFT_1851013 [Mycena leptocephala]|nr:hypothetical protein B0H13DRAFT_1851013 [Mycena leptocephala]